MILYVKEGVTHFIYYVTISNELLLGHIVSWLVNKMVSRQGLRTDNMYSSFLTENLIFKYCMSILHSNLLYEMVNYFLDTQYTQTYPLKRKNLPKIRNISCCCANLDGKPSYRSPRLVLVILGYNKYMRKLQKKFLHYWSDH